jgi:octopine/nopaline transport system substrate-binding protein|tara:strand:- start:8207 stop:9040 length:834 start_codon:yes stop_codon:yes gene_type:complete
VRIFKFFTTLLITLSLSSFALAGDWSKIRIGTEGAYEPWNYTNAAGELVGAEIDLARDLCARMNADCEFVQQDWDGIIPALTNGKYDAIMAGMSITEERMKTISFSSAYMTEPARMSTVKGSPLTTLSTAKNLNLDDDSGATKGTIGTLNAALKGLRIGVTAATIHEDFANTHLSSAELKIYPTQDEMNLDLSAGRIDAALSDIGTIEAYMGTPSGANVAFFGPNIFGGLLGEGVGAGIRQEDSDLKAMFDKAIAEAAADGTIGRISTQYFGKDLAP